jgi:hypothetical protein
MVTVSVSFLASISDLRASVVFNNHCCDKGSDIAMACDRWKESGKDKVESTVGIGAEQRGRGGLALLPIASFTLANTSN